MYPYITIFGNKFSTYSLFIVLGIISCIIYILFRRRQFNISIFKEEIIVILGCLGAFLGSKILYFIVTWSDIQMLFQYFGMTSRSFFEIFINSGFVFYGGFYGAIGLVALYCFLSKTDKWEVSRLFMPCVPLFHFFGRIGCFMAGCCYGIESNTFGILFTNSRIAPSDVKIIPVQLVESICELILFVILWRMSKKQDSGKKMFILWLITYSIIRFILEFLRGDEARGFIGPFSTSQIIGIISILFGFVILYWKPENRPTFSFINKKANKKKVSK